jgi:small subunit ribosomal protein S16
MLMIRFQRIGRKNDPAYRISVLEKARAARAGRVVDQIGSYNPKTKAFAIDETRAKDWMAHGAQPTDTVRNLLIAKGVVTGKQVDVFPASARKKARITAEKAAADAAAAKKAEEAAAATKAAEDAVPAAPAEAAAPEAPAENPTPETEAPAAETPAA